MLILKNPHSIREALELRPKDVVEVRYFNKSAPSRLDSRHPIKGQKDRKGQHSQQKKDVIVEKQESQSFQQVDDWQAVANLAIRLGVPVLDPDVHSSQFSKRDRGEGNKFEQGGRESKAHALVKEKQGLPIEHFFKPAQDGYGIWLALDCLQDPQNVGAIFRAAAFFGVKGIVMTEERSAPLSAVAYDVACGGVEHVPFTIQTNLKRCIEEAKTQGLWVLGTSEHAKQKLKKLELDRNWLIVLGNEEKGLRRLTLESCDLLATIQPSGGSKGVTSLNVSSVNAAILSHFLQS